MLLEIDHFYQGYSQILADCRGEETDDGGISAGGSALILCNADVDALASARILSYMLRSDGVSYQVRPCISYSHLLTILQSHRGVDDLCAIILLNLGATRNLTRLFNQDALLDTKITIYVLDFRRPIHLANIHDGENVVIFWDSVNTEDVPSDGDNLSGNESSTDEEDEETSSEEESSDGGENEFDEELDGNNDDGKAIEDQPMNSDDQSPKHDLNHETDIASAGGEDEMDYDAEDELGPRTSRTKRQKIDRPSDLSDENTTDGSVDRSGPDSDKTGNRSDEPPSPNQNAESQASSFVTMTPRERHQDRRKRIRDYYSVGSFFGSPASYIAYRIATQLRFGELGDLLWLTCVGITDAYLHARLDVVGYSAIAINLRSACARLFPDDMYRRADKAVYAEHLIRGNSETNNDRTKIGFSDNGRLLSETDFRFFLLRHTSLYNAMLHSNFVAARLQLNTAKGIQCLQEFLAKMGYPLEECRQPFAFMKSRLRRQLQRKIQEHGEEFGLDGLEFTSFFRVTGYQSLLSASDAAYAITALLEIDIGGAPTAGTSQAQEEEELMRSFNVAYDALNSYSVPAVSLSGLSAEDDNLVGLVNGTKSNGTTGIGAGIGLAMAIQKKIMTTAANLIGRQAITRLTHFRYSYITCTSQGENAGASDNFQMNGQKSRDTNKNDDHIFAKPLCLTRLAHFLMDLHRENGKWKGAKARPLILLAEKPRTKTFLVGGFAWSEDAGTVSRNLFGKNFELAAQSMQGFFRFDSFDSHILEVAAVDAQRFLEQLHYLLDSI